MVNFCVAYNCNSSSDIHRNVIFHKFPDSVKEKIRFKKWLHAVKRKNFKPSVYSRLCSLHFTKSDLIPPVVCGPLKLKQDAVPSIFQITDHMQLKQSREIRTLVRVKSDEIPSETQLVSSVTLFLFSVLHVL